MVSGPITSLQIDGEIVETVADYISGGSKITADGDGSREIKRRLLLGRKVMTNLGCSPWGHKESDMTERFPFTFHFHALEKEIATHSSILVWRIPGTEEPGGLPSMGSHRV